MIESGRLSDRYRIGTDTGHIVSNRIGYFCIGRIAAGSAAVNHRRSKSGRDLSPSVRERHWSTTIRDWVEGGGEFECSLQHCSR